MNKRSNLDEIDTQIILHILVKKHYYHYMLTTYLQVEINTNKPHFVVSSRLIFYSAKINLELNWSLSIFVSFINPFKWSLLSSKSLSNVLSINIIFKSFSLSCISNLDKLKWECQYVRQFRASICRWVVVWLNPLKILHPPLS